MMHHGDKTPRISTNTMNRTPKELKSPDIDTEVCDRMVKSVICRVEKFEVSRSHRSSVAFSAISAAAIVALVPIIIYVWHSSSRSGFGQYMSLVSSDSAYMLEHWKEFLLSAATSLPIMGAIVVLLILLIFVNSIRRMMSYASYSNEVKRRLLTT